MLRAEIQILTALVSQPGSGYGYSQVGSATIARGVLGGDGWVDGKWRMVLPLGPELTSIRPAPRAEASCDREEEHPRAPGLVLNVAPRGVRNPSDHSGVDCKVADPPRQALAILNWGRKGASTQTGS